MTVNAAAYSGIYGGLITNSSPNPATFYALADANTVFAGSINNGVGTDLVGEAPHRRSSR